MRLGINQILIPGFLATQPDLDAFYRLSPAEQKRAFQDWCNSPACNQFLENWVKESMGRFIKAVSQLGKTFDNFFGPVEIENS